MGSYRGLVSAAVLACAALVCSFNNAVAGKTTSPSQYKMRNGQQICLDRGGFWYAIKRTFGDEGHWKRVKGVTFIVGTSPTRLLNTGMIIPAKSGYPLSYVYVAWDRKNPKNATVVAGDELTFVKKKCDRPWWQREHDVASASDDRSEKGGPGIEPGQYFFYNADDGRCLKKSGEWYGGTSGYKWRGRWGVANKSSYLFATRKDQNMLSVMMTNGDNLSYSEAYWFHGTEPLSTHSDRKLDFFGRRCER